METSKEITRRLDLIAALLLRLIPRGNEGLNGKEQIALLDGFGMRPIEIASILGKTPKYVSKELAGIRKSRAN